MAELMAGPAAQHIKKTPLYGVSFLVYFKTPGFTCFF